MSAIPLEAGISNQPEEQESPEPLHFREEVTINGLPYIFEGDIPVEPAKFDWSVSLPNWDEQKPAADEMRRTGGIEPNFDKWLERHKLGDGKVGSLEIEYVDPPDHAPAVRVDMIRTETVHLSPEFGYNKAKGIGSFLMNNLCALADLKGWRLYLDPVDKGGRLTQGEIYYWYKKLGFEDPYIYPKQANYHDDMQRWPNEPDSSQVVTSLIRKR